jgi:hypothetical protein
MPDKEEEKVVELFTAYKEKGLAGIKEVLRRRDEEFVRRMLETAGKPDESEKAES